MPVITRMRKPIELETDRVDVFHDVFGLTPLLSNIYISQYLAALGSIANRYQDNVKAMESINRVYWHTIRYGLVRENKKVKLYGTSILSSITEVLHCLSEHPCLDYCSVEKMADTPRHEGNTSQYFFVDSLSELPQLALMLERYCENIYGEKGVKSGDIRVAGREK